MAGPFPIRAGRRFELVDGRIFTREPDADPSGVVYRQAGGPAEFVFRASQSGERPCTALVGRRLQQEAGRLVGIDLVPSDFTVSDMIDVSDSTA